RGGEYAYTWATLNPDKVSCIYADNPGANREMIGRLGELAKYDVPLLHVCGSIDPLLGRSSNVIEAMYQQYGGRISVMIKEGAGHHPHSLRDATPIADFMEASVKSPTTRQTPAYVGTGVVRTSFYSVANSYRLVEAEGLYVTSRGPLLSAAY